MCVNTNLEASTEPVGIYLNSIVSKHSVRYSLDLSPCDLKISLTGFLHSVKCRHTKVRQL